MMMITTALFVNIQIMPLGPASLVESLAHSLALAGFHPIKTPDLFAFQCAPNHACLLRTPISPIKEWQIQLLGQSPPPLAPVWAQRKKLPNFNHSARLRNVSKRQLTGPGQMPASQLKLPSPALKPITFYQSWTRLIWP